MAVLFDLFSYRVKNFLMVYILIVGMGIHFLKYLCPKNYIF